jgi:heme o synthase
MLPVVHGEGETRRQILIYSLILAPLGIVPYIMGFGGLTYGVVSLGMGALFLVLAFRVYRVRTGAGAPKAARELFAYSILYLFVLYATLLGEAVMLAPGA